MIVLSVLADFFVQYNYMTAVFLLMFGFGLLWKVMHV